MKMAYELEKTLDELKSASYRDEFTLGISEFRLLLQWWIAEKVKRPEQIFDESDMLKLKNQICHVRHYRWKEIGRSINKRSRDCKSNWVRYVQKRTWTEQEGVLIQTEGEMAYGRIPEKSKDAIARKSSPPEGPSRRSNSDVMPDSTEKLIGFGRRHRGKSRARECARN
jgi:hypothetical protein